MQAVSSLMHHRGGGGNDQETTDSSSGEDAIQHHHNYHWNESAAWHPAAQTVYSNQWAALATQQVEALVEDYAPATGELTVLHKEDEAEGNDNNNTTDNSDSFTSARRYQGRDAVRQFYDGLFENWSDMTDFELLHVKQLRQQQHHQQEEEKEETRPVKTKPTALSSLRRIGSWMRGRRRRRQQQQQQQPRPRSKQVKRRSGSSASTAPSPPPSEHEMISPTEDAPRMIAPLSSSSSSIVLVWAWKCPSRGIARATNTIVLNEIAEPEPDPGWKTRHRFLSGFFGPAARRRQQQYHIVQHHLVLERCSDGPYNCDNHYYG